MVTSLFEKVEDKDVKRILYTHKHHPWGLKQLKHKIYMIPVAEDKQVLRLNFPVPNILNLYYTAVNIDFNAHSIVGKKVHSVHY